MTESFADLLAPYHNKIYPKPLPEFKADPLIDEMNFYLTEKTALKKAWNFIAPFKRRFGKEIYYNFLTKQEENIDIFRFGSEKIILEKLHNHALAIMNYIEGIVYNALDCPPIFKMMYTEHWERHDMCNVTMDTICLLAQDIVDYLLKALKDHSSETLKRAFHKIKLQFSVTERRTISSAVNKDLKQGMSSIYGRVPTKKTLL